MVETIYQTYPFRITCPVPSGKSSAFVIIQYWHCTGSGLRVFFLPASPVTKLWATTKFLNIWMILPSTPSFQGFQVMLSRHLGCGGGALASTSRTWLLSLRRHPQGGPATSGLGCGDVLLLSFSDWTPSCLVTCTGHPGSVARVRNCPIEAHLTMAQHAL